MAVKKDAQVGMDDVWVKDPELEEMLEKREERKEVVSSYRKFDKEVKAKIAGLDTKPPFRCGRFMVKLQKHQAHEVNFEVGETESISIAPVD